MNSDLYNLAMRLNLNVAGERVIVLILLIAIAYTSAALQVQQIKRARNTKIYRSC